MTTNRIRWVAAVLVAAGLFGACSDTETTEPTESVASTESASTTIAATTTVAPTTAAAPSTTVAATAFLRSDGLGPFNFADAYATVLAGMPLALESDDSYSFPTADVAFAHASGREVCWDDGVGGSLCGYFGGADAASVVLVGWDYEPDTAAVGSLYSASGATINILLSAVPAMPLPEGDCYGDTTVVLDGISLDITSNSDEWFGSYADDGTFVLSVPQPANATVRYMSTGDLMYFGEGADC